VSDDVIEKEAGHSIRHVIKYFHGIIPLCIIINAHNYVIMDITICKMTLHKVDVKFAKRNDNDNKV
jgi:hypothetical protein